MPVASPPATACTACASRRVWTAPLPAKCPMVAAIRTPEEARIATTKLPASDRGIARSDLVANAFARLANVVDLVYVHMT